MDRYFKVPMDAAKALVSSSVGPELLAGYMVLRRWACNLAQGKKDYRFTAAGAKSIRECLGLSDFRAKKVHRQLLELRFGERGELGFITPTDKHIKNARVYEFGEWQGPDAYVPDLLIQGDSVPLQRLCKSDSEPETKRDALLMLLHVYANVDYAEFFGVAPDEFVHKEWIDEGIGTACDAEFELGYIGSVERFHFWLLKNPIDEPKKTYENNASAIYGKDDAALERFWQAHELLTSTGMLCRVAVVDDGYEPYPLWIFSRAYREALQIFGIGDLASQIFAAAYHQGFDPDSYIARSAVSEDREYTGTELFICLTRGTRIKAPVVRTIYAPLFHAPTPLNTQGLYEMSRRMQDWGLILNKLSGRKASPIRAA